MRKLNDGSCRPPGELCRPARQPAELMTEAELKPSAVIEDVDFICCGEPVVTRLPDCEDGVCRVLVRQNVILTITFRWEIDAETGDAGIICK